MSLYDSMDSLEYLDMMCGVVNFPIKTEDIVFPIPISEGRIITINNLPVELNKEDAEKICRVVMALSIKE